MFRRKWASVVWMTGAGNVMRWPRMHWTRAGAVRSARKRKRWAPLNRTTAVVRVTADGDWLEAQRARVDRPGPLVTVLEGAETVHLF